LILGLTILLLLTLASRKAVVLADIGHWALGLV
jgi:hypothetical protein